MFKVVGDEGSEGSEGSFQKRLKLSPEVEGDTDNGIVYIFPKNAVIHQKIRCLLLEYILSPAFLAYGPPTNFQYYPHPDKWFPPAYDMRQYDPTQ